MQSAESKRVGERRDDKWVVMCSRYRGKPSQVGLLMVRPIPLQASQVGDPHTAPQQDNATCLLPLLVLVLRLTPEAQAPASQGLLVRKSLDGRGAAFVGVLDAEKRTPETHFKFNMFFCKSGPGFTSLMPCPCAEQAQATAGMISGNLQARATRGHQSVEMSRSREMSEEESGGSSKDEDSEHSDRTYDSHMVERERGGQKQRSGERSGSRASRGKKRQERPEERERGSSEQGGLQRREESGEGSGENSGRSREQRKRSGVRGVRREDPKAMSVDNIRHGTGAPFIADFQSPETAHEASYHGPRGQERALHSLQTTQNDSRTSPDTISITGRLGRLEAAVDGMHMPSAVIAQRISRLERVAGIAASAGTSLLARIVQLERMLGI